MGIVDGVVKALTGESGDSGDRFGEDFYGRFKELDLDSVEEVREIREK